MIGRCVVFDVGRVLFDWDLRHLFAKLIDDKDRLEWFVTHVVTPEWHFQHDAGRPLAEMLPELKAEFPGHDALIDAYAARFNETIPGPMPGSLELVERLDEAGVPLFAITNFGHEFWEGFRPTQPITSPAGLADSPSGSDDPVLVNLARAVQALDIAGFEPDATLGAALRRAPPG